MVHPNCIKTHVFQLPQVESSSVDSCGFQISASELSTSSPVHWIYCRYHIWNAQQQWTFPGTIPWLLTDWSKMPYIASFLCAQGNIFFIPRVHECYSKQISWEKLIAIQEAMSYDIFYWSLKETCSPPLGDQTALEAEGPGPSLEHLTIRPLRSLKHQRSPRLSSISAPNYIFALWRLVLLALLTRVIWYTHVFLSHQSVLLSLSLCFLAVERLQVSCASRAQTLCQPPGAPGS